MSLHLYKANYGPALLVQGMNFKSSPFLLP